MESAHIRRGCGARPDSEACVWPSASKSPRSSRHLSSACPHRSRQCVVSDNFTAVPSSVILVTGTAAAILVDAVENGFVARRHPPSRFSGRCASHRPAWRAPCHVPAMFCVGFSALAWARTWTACTVAIMAMHSRSLRTKSSLRAARSLMVPEPFLKSDPQFRTQASNDGESFL